MSWWQCVWLSRSVAEARAAEGAADAGREHYITARCHGVATGSGSSVHTAWSELHFVGTSRGCSVPWPPPAAGQRGFSPCPLTQLVRPPNFELQHRTHRCCDRRSEYTHDVQRLIRCLSLHSTWTTSLLPSPCRRRDLLLAFAADADARQVERIQLRTTAAQCNCSTS